MKIFFLTALLCVKMNFEIAVTRIPQDFHKLEAEKSGLFEIIEILILSACKLI